MVCFSGEEQIRINKRYQCSNRQRTKIYYKKYDDSVRKL